MNINVGKTRTDLVQPFRDAVERSIRDGGEVGIQVAAYLDGKLVVDIWGGIADPTTGQEVKANTLFPTFSVIKAVTATALHIQVSRGLDARETTFVVVDLEGTASLMVAQAMSRADLVIIPTKGSELDAIEAIKVIGFIGRQEKAYNKKIPFAVLFTQTNPAVRPRTLKSLEQDLLSQGIPLFSTALHERDAFRAIFSFGGILSGLDQSAVGGVPMALANARQFMAETIALLKQQQLALQRHANVA